MKCTDCPDQAGPYHSRCEPCREAARIRHNARYDALKASGLCPRCKEYVDVPGRVVCTPCSAVMRAKQMDARGGGHYRCSECGERGHNRRSCGR